MAIVLKYALAIGALLPIDTIIERQLLCKCSYRLDTLHSTIGHSPLGQLILIISVAKYEKATCPERTASGRGCIQPWQINSRDGNGPRVGFLFNEIKP